MPQPNNLLRAARERTPSRRVPGTHMSREELAEAVVMWLAAHDDKNRAVAFDANHLGKLERRHRRPPLLHRVAESGALVAATDRANDPISRRIRGAVIDFHRNTVVRELRA